MLSEAKIGWAAGILDGEGCICGQWTNKRNRSGGNVSVDVRVEVTSLVMLDNLASICDQLGVEFVIRQVGRRAMATREAYRFSVCRREQVVKFLSVLMPYLTVKRPEAEIVLRWFETTKRHSKTVPMSDKLVFFESLRGAKKIA